MWDVFDVRTCRGCGCTDDEGCWPPCFWVDQFWCSACEYQLGRRLTMLAVALACVAAVLALLAGALGAHASFQSGAAAGIFAGLAALSAVLIGHVGKRMLEVAQ